MSKTFLNNVKVVLPGGVSDEMCLTINNGKISEMGQSAPNSAEGVDLSGAVIFSGFIDVHNHGAVGVDVNDADAEGLLKIAAFLAENGVTSWLPTLVPDSDENYRRAINEIDRLMELQVGKPVAQAVGVHYEGVFANEKMCGALRPEYFRTWADVGERTTPARLSSPNASAQSGDHPSSVKRGVGGLPILKNGVHMTTLAPEIEGGVELVRELVAHGWIVSVGHTAADTATLDAAFASGARHMTHFFNAMTGVHHREIGVAGWGLANPDVTFDIIADGVHVHPRMLRFACGAKSPDKVTLISDSVAPTGLGDGEFRLWGETISVTNGRTQNERGSIAGSVCTMLDGVRMMRSLGFTDVEVANMAASNPAKLIGIDHLTGSLSVGKSADLVAIDADGHVVLTVVRGHVVQK